jgi:uncharacterized LabA/DUF88 family protein
MSTNKLNNFAFIDSQNVNLGVRAQGWRLDFARFRIYLKDKYSVTKAFLFIGYVSGNERLYTYLQTVGYVLVFKPILEIHRKKDTVIKGNVDAELVLHTMIQYENYDKAVIVSGDGDFHCLIEYLEEKKKLARVLIPNRRKYSRLLYKYNEYCDYLNNLREKMGIKKEGVAIEDGTSRSFPSS